MPKLKIQTSNHCLISATITVDFRKPDIQNPNLSKLQTLKNLDFGHIFMQPRQNCASLDCFIYLYKTVLASKTWYCLLTKPLPVVQILDKFGFQTLTVNCILSLNRLTWPGILNPNLGVKISKCTISEISP